MATELLKGIQPFWFWNGKMDHEEIVRQIDEMSEKGIQGFLIHPRQGLELPYLTEEYFERVKTAVAEAKKHGMEVWLYDEYPYPSGVSAGQVMLDHPEYCCKALTKTVGTAKDGETLRLYAPWGHVLSARAYRVKDGTCDFNEYVDLMDYIGTGYSDEIFQLSGLTAYNRKRFFTGSASKYLYWTALEGEWKVYIFVEQVMRHFKYFENFVDPLNPAAIRYFLETTHEKYKKYIGDEFGKTVKGIFSDEVTAFPPQQPWSVLLPELVKKRYGRNLIDVLPALTEDMGPETQRIRFEYWDTAVDAFIESYDKQVYDWCEENHLMYIGEKPILRSKELEYVHVPGTDAGHAKVGAAANPLPGKYRANGKIISSAAHFYNKPAALCEAFHSIGWGMTMQDMKWIFDWLAIGGVDWYIQHAFYYSTDGLKKHDAPPSSFCQMPWWKEQRLLSDYALGLGKMLGKMKRHVRTLLIDPATSRWVISHAEKREHEAAISAIMNSLMGSGCDFYVIDPQLLAEAKVEERNGRTVVSLKDESFDSIVMPNMNNIEDGAYRVVRCFAEKGGILVCAGDMPVYNVQREQSAEWFAAAFGTGKDNLLKTSIYDVGRKLAEIYKEQGWNYDRVPEGSYVITGTDEAGREMIFAVNTTSDIVKIRLSGSFTGELYTLELAEGKMKHERAMDGVLDIELKPWASVVYVLASESGEQGLCHEMTLPYEKKDWRIRRRRENAIYLGKWQLTLPDGQSGITGCYPIIDQLEELELKMPVKTMPYFGCPKELVLQETEAVYEAEFGWMAPEGTKAWLVMEPETLSGAWSIRLNDHEIKEKDFSVHPFYLNTNQAVDVTEYMQRGRNRIVVRVHCAKSYDGLRNPMYIFGDFGVTIEEKRCVAIAASESGAIGRDLENGLPFYAGDVEYSREIVLEQPVAYDTLLKLDIPEVQDVVRVYINGKDCGVCAWTPRELRIPAGIWKEGSNQVSLVISNTLAGLFEGQRFDQKQHKYVQLEDEAQDITRERQFNAW